MVVGLRVLAEADLAESGQEGGGDSDGGESGLADLDLLFAASSLPLFRGDSGRSDGLCARGRVHLRGADDAARRREDEAPGFGQQRERRRRRQRERSNGADKGPLGRVRRQAAPARGRLPGAVPRTASVALWGTCMVNAYEALKRAAATKPPSE